MTQPLPKRTVPDGLTPEQEREFWQRHEEEMRRQAERSKDYDAWWDNHPRNPKRKRPALDFAAVVLIVLIALRLLTLGGAP